MKAHWLITLFCCIAFSPIGLAQNGTLAPGSAQAMAMGQTGVAYAGPHSLWRNQAALAELQNPVLIAMAERRFLLADIRSAACE